MKKRFFSSLLLLPLLSWANSSDDMANHYFSNKMLSLTPQEKTALSIGKQWQTGMATSKPVAGRDGSINFIYGSGQTQVVCAVLQVCDVALQSGEQVNNLNVGDPRFTIEPALTGSGPSAQVHLLIKALDVGLESSLVVATDRRTYHFRLRSTRHQFMPYISFTYPEEAQMKWALLKQANRRHQEAFTIPETQEYLGNLNFNYAIEGRARFKPVRVYNDGVKTIIEMPKTFQQADAPTLLVVRNKGFFRKSQTTVVNYRIQGCRYIVDSVFDKAMLIVGVGSAQEKIIIRRCS